ncbi:MAG: hypothetical protein VKL00_11115 [Synechococcales bacterium]|nr:hypothetical protein [Cyanobacteria bacterium REEB444]MEB3126155.1 hypothetical protein [Synechococcales bacterium]
MTIDPTPIQNAPITVSSQTNSLVDQELANETDAVKRETKALIEAIKKRAQSEVQGAGDFTRDAYLNAVKQARDTIEHTKIFDPEQLERSFDLIQKEAEKNLQAIIKETNELGDRLNEAAKAAWTVLTSKRDGDE